MISILSVLLTGGALVYSHRADKRAVASGTRAAEGQERADERVRASARLAALDRIKETIHDLSHSSADALGGVWTLTMQQRDSVLALQSWSRWRPCSCPTAEWLRLGLATVLSSRTSGAPSARSRGR